MFHPLLSPWFNPMFLPPSVKIFMANKPVDMRKGFDGLLSIVRRSWQKDIFSGHLFVFLSSRYDRVKILFWDSGGFVLYYKRLEKGRFKPLSFHHEQESVELDSTQLFLLLDGIDFTKVRRKKHWSPLDK